MPSEPTTNAFLFIYYCSGESCNLVATCPTSCVFVLLCYLTIFCYVNVILFMPFISQRRSLESCPKIVVEMFIGNNFNGSSRPYLVEDSLSLLFNPPLNCFLNLGKCIMDSPCILFICFQFFDFVYNLII